MKHLLLLVLIALSFASCEKQELVDDMGNEITIEQAISTLDIDVNRVSSPTGKGASQEITLTINGNANSFELYEDFSTIDADFIHYSQAYDRRAVIGQDAEGNDVEERVFIYFTIAIENGVAVDGEVQIQHPTDQTLTINLSDVNVNRENISYDDGALSFRLTL